MKRLVVLILALSIFSIPATSQIPTPEIQWTADWEIDQEVAIMELNSDTYTFELTLGFWINNNRLTPIEVDFDVDFEEVEFEVDDPGKVSVDANTNKTFELKVTGSGLKDDMILHNADDFSETLTLTISEIIGEQAIGTPREITQNLQFSEVYEIDVEWEAAGLTASNVMLDVKAGTSESMNVQVFNYGNSDDAVTKYSVSVSKCPQLDYEVDLVSDLPMSISPATNLDDGVAFAKITITAPSSHPTKECEIEFSVVSEATGFSYYATMFADVEASKSSSSDDKEESNEDSANTETSNLESDSSSLPAISSLLCTITVLFTAFIRRKSVI